MEKTVSLKRKHLIFGVVILALISLVTVGSIFNLKSTSPNGNSGGMRMTIDDNAVPLGQEPDTGVPGIKIPGFASVKISANKSEVEISLANPEENPCYFVYEIILKETGESLYQSDLVEPGTSIQNVSLSRPLEVGEYPSTIRVRTYDLESMTELNGANMQTVIKVI